MNLLFLKGLLNYRNRVILKYPNLSDYRNNATAYVDFQGINFNPNDGVDAEIVIGSESQQINSLPLDWENDGSPSYLVCYETVNKTDSIKHRWFVIECSRTRKGQYRMKLRRDVVADSMESVLEDVSFIEKGTITDLEDPMLLNKEDVDFNEVKKDEFLLKDETQSAWIVGYVADVDDEAKDVTIQGGTFETPYADLVPTETYTSIGEFYVAHDDIAKRLGTGTTWKASLFVTGSSKLSKIGRSNDGELIYDGNVGKTLAPHVRCYDYASNHLKNVSAATAIHATRQMQTAAAFKNSMYSSLAGLESCQIVGVDSDEYLSLMEYVNSNPVVSINGVLYSVIDSVSKREVTLYPKNGDQLQKLVWQNIVKSGYESPEGQAPIIDYLFDGTPGNGSIEVSYSMSVHELSLTPLFTEATVDVPATAPKLKDQPYSMFAIPYGEIDIFKNGSKYVSTNRSIAIQAAQTIVEKSGSGFVYDVQVLPFCPQRRLIQSEVKEDGELYVSSALTTDDSYKTVGLTVVQTKLPLLGHRYAIRKGITESGFTLQGLSQKTIVQPINRVPIIVEKYDGGDIDRIVAGSIGLVHTDPSDNTSALKIIAYDGAWGEGNVLLEETYSTYSSSADETITITLQEVPNALIYEQLLSRYQTMSMSDGFKFGSSWLYDAIYIEPSTKTTLSLDNVIHSDITVNNGNDVVNVVIWCDESIFTFDKVLNRHYYLKTADSWVEDYPSSQIVDAISYPSDPIEVKVRNQTQKLRIVDPHYSSFFDVNVQMNKGVSSINVDCTYKPYAPYIHMNPDFKYLYGNDYNDARGLIFGGDYSIALTTSAWSTYKLQNKNYQNIFDRQMQVLEETHKLQLTQDVFSAVAGAGSGAASGAFTGNVVGGGLMGAGIGAVAGGVTSLGAGIADVAINQRLRELDKGLRKDTFSYNLGNIKALPNGLAKTSCLTNNNKIFPVLEYYSATQTEIDAFRNKIEYDGMTIGRIGKISDFVGTSLTHVKANLIRTNVVEDYHFVETLAQELNAGVYLIKEE